MTPREAQLLIELVEMLCEDWYVARRQRQARLSQLKETADAKEKARSSRAKSPVAAAAQQ